VDATGQYESRAGELKKFNGVDDLAKFLADSNEVHAAFVTQLFHNLVQQPVRAYGVRCPEELRTFFAHSGFNIRKLAVEIATTAALTGREPKQQARQNGHEKAQKDAKIKTE
jgi:hypothetical protein